MPTPSLGTIKRLFSMSGNRCAFPRCEQELVDAESGKVTGRVCHIRAQSPCGPRYDENQSDAERQAFANLILMCPVHHDVIDADPESYTVARIEEIKSRQEARHRAGTDPTDDIALRLVGIASNSAVVGGSVVTSINQFGGQTAHSIVNVGKRARTVDPAAAADLVSELRRHPPEEFTIHTLISGNGESLQFAQTLERILTNSGWRSLGVMHSVFNPPVVGILIQTPNSDPIVAQPGLTAFIRWLLGAGFAPRSAKNVPIEEMQIIVGPQAND